MIVLGAAAEAMIFIGSSPGKLDGFLPVSMADPFLAIFSRFDGAYIRLLKVIIVFTSAPDGRQKLFWAIAPVSRENDSH